MIFHMANLTIICIQKTFNHAETVGDIIYISYKDQRTQSTTFHHITCHQRKSDKTEFLNCLISMTDKKTKVPGQGIIVPFDMSLPARMMISRVD